MAARSEEITPAMLRYDAVPEKSGLPKIKPRISKRSVPTKKAIGKAINIGWIGCDSILAVLLIELILIIVWAAQLLVTSSTRYISFTHLLVSALSLINWIAELMKLIVGLLKLYGCPGKCACMYSRAL